MLHKSKISGVRIYSDEWYQNRLAKFTSSEIHFLMGRDEYNDTAISYIRRKVGEELTGKPARGDIDTEATRWGNFHEAEAITKFGISRGIEWLVTQQLICESNSRFGGTPDALNVLRISPDEMEYEVETVEVKCPPTFDNYIKLFECDTPQDVKKAEYKYYWQVIDQMDNCGSMKGNLVAYHPDFKAGNMKAIPFDAMQVEITSKGKVFPLYNDLKLLRERKKSAETKFDEIRTKLMAVKRV